MLAPGKFYHDTVIRIDISFTDGNGAAVDPATVVFKAKSRFGSEFTYTYGTDSQVGRTAAGEYFADLTPDAPGNWHYRWQTTGTGTTLRTEGELLVQDSPFYDWGTNTSGWGWWY
jgi:hypothetical protein